MSAAWISSIPYLLPLCKTQVLYHDQVLLPHFFFSLNILPKLLPLAAWNSALIPGQSLLLWASVPFPACFSSALNVLHPLLYLENLFLCFKTKLKYPLFWEAFADPHRQKFAIPSSELPFHQFPSSTKHIFYCFAFILQVMSQSIPSICHTISNRIGWVSEYILVGDGKGDSLRFAFFPMGSWSDVGLFTLLRVNKMRAWNHRQPCCHYEENTAWKWTSNKERQSLCKEWNQVPMVTFEPLDTAVPEVRQDSNFSVVKAIPTFCLSHFEHGFSTYGKQN